jgi:8-oxo-dGTP pyrophosphatase MutT (NUDIX family)
MTRIKPWHELSREQLADCRIFTVERSRAMSPSDGSEHDYFRVRSQDWVQVVPVTVDNEVVMVRQYRHGSQQVTLEIPGGLVDAGEDPAVAALRECEEETGFTAPSVQPLSSLNPNPAIHAHRLHAFVAPGAHRVAAIRNTATEQTEVELVPVAGLAERLRAGAIDHALVAATLWQFLCETVDGRGDSSSL